MRMDKILETIIIYGEWYGMGEDSGGEAIMILLLFTPLTFVTCSFHSYIIFFPLWRSLHVVAQTEQHIFFS